MKKIIFFVAILFFVQLSFAQAYDGIADYNKKSQQAVFLDLKYPEETVIKTLKDKIERLGLKLKSSKGFMVAYNAVISDISSTQMEYAFSVDRKSKREKETTVITMIMNINDANTTSENASKAKDFLNSLTPAIDALNIENMANDQTDVLNKAQKKLKNLKDDQSSLEKRIRNLQDDLSKNDQQQKDQQKEIQRQQEILDSIKAKRK